MNEKDVAQQEGALREVNEGIESGVWSGESEHTIRMRCECGRTDCNAFIPVRIEAYEAVRASPRQFILRAGHERPEVETVVSRQLDYIVVEKTGLAGLEAERLDARDGGSTDVSAV